MIYIIGDSHVSVFSGTDTTHDDYVLRIAWVGHGGAGPDTGPAAIRYMQDLLPQGQFTMADSLPDIILFMSGGSERMAIEAADPVRFCC